MIAARNSLLSLLIVTGSFGSGLAAGVKARAEVSCAATAKPLEYDCTIKLSDSRSGAALTDVEVTVRADMPSMPMAHNVKPAKAMPGNEPGTYRAHIKLEMHGDWVVKLDLVGPVRDRIVKSMRFEPKP
ncbi:FixH family protein [Bradyrhizobium sp. AUGA SZCCT0431]|uniref:FixH family protein n=1 Tax=Bradyrhizobium sp. AUGA SZCCT0431 TaxID=2807674 RepID=UPI001BA5F626|nr:FixH family protein [Bradyrhizobium sp. AUGA SZCCT0431]MBR1143079.1 FixH family protein [Bradyrhizobium sp. AUGA SZCCT0431]